MKKWTMMLKVNVDLVLTMVKKTELKKYALNVLDYLYYHDYVFLENNTNVREVQYSLILEMIDNLNLERGYDGKKAELYKHFLLSGFEIKSNILREDYNFQLLKDFGQLYEKLLNEVIACNFLEDDFLKDLDCLMTKFKEVSKNFIFKFVGFCLYYEYGSMAIGGLISLLSREILDLKKYRSKFWNGYESLMGDEISTRKNKTGEKEIEKKSLDVFFRAMLFVEFEIMKNQIFIKDKINLMTIDFKKDEAELDEDILFANLITRSKKLINIKYKSISSQDFDFDNDFLNYICDISNRLNHQKIFFDDVNGCAGYIGGLYVKYSSRYMEEGAINKAPEYESIIDLYRETNITYAENAILIMDRFGFEFKSSRTLYNYYPENKLVCNWFEEGLYNKYISFFPDYLIYFHYKKERFSPPFFMNFILK